MDELEKVLLGVRPQEPSPGYVNRGLDRIAAYSASSDLVSRRWQYAAAVLALLLAGSLILNVTSRIEARQQAASEPVFAFSSLRQEGDLLIRETRYEHPGDPGGRR